MDNHRDSAEEAHERLQAQREGAGVVSGAPAEAAEVSTATGPRQQQEVMAPAQRRAQLVVNERGYIAPTSIEEAIRMAQAVIAGNLAPDSYKGDQTKVMLGIMAALEAGLPPLYGLRQIAIINGRPSIWGDAAMALIQSKNLLTNQEITTTEPTPMTDIKDWPDTFGFEVKLWRRGQAMPYIGRFTVADAKRAHLWTGTQTGQKPKLPWYEHPLRMLMIRARAFPQRDGFADALAGLAIREEVEDTFGEDGDSPVDTSFLDDTPKVEAPPMPINGEEAQ